MKITGLTKKKNVVTVVFDNEVTLAADAGLAEEIGLFEGAELSLADFKKLNFAFACKYAMETSLKALSRSSYTEKQLREKLRAKNIQYDAIDDAIEKLKGYKYINDERYAEYFVSDSSNMGKSKRDIQTKLKQKGVEEVLIQKALEAYSQADEGKNLKNFIKKQALLLSEYPPAIKRKKLTEKAVRRGFAYEDISREIEAVLENENSDDYEEYYIKKIKKRISASKDSDEAKLRAKLYSEFLPLGAEKELINTLIENAKGNGEE